MEGIQIFIFLVGVIVMTMVIYALFSLVPAEIRGPEEVGYYSSSDEQEKKKASNL